MNIGKLDDYLILRGKSGFQKLINKAMEYPDYLLSCIPKDTTLMQMSERLTPLLLFLSKRPKEEATLYLKTICKSYIRDEMGLKITNSEIKELTKKINTFKAQQNENKSNLSDSEIKSALQDDQQMVKIHPVQDFYDGDMYYLIKAKGNKFLINSKKEILSFGKLNEMRIVVDPQSSDTSRFSPTGILKLLDNNTDIRPDVLFKTIQDYIKRYIFFTDERQTVLLALWIMGTYCFKIFSIYPYLWFTAPKRSGKTLLMQVMCPISFNGEHVVSMTMSVLFRNVHNNLSTIFIDEAEHFTQGDRESRGQFISLLNNGFSNSGEVQRTAKDKDGQFFIEKFSAFSAKCLGGINQIDSVLQDRVIKVVMVRKRNNEPVDRYKLDDNLKQFQKSVRDQLYHFGLQYANKIYERYKRGPVKGLEHLSNRSLDLWEPIFVLANLIDDASGNGDELTKSMSDLSKKELQERGYDDEEQDDLTKVIMAMKRFMESNKPRLLKSGENFYEALVVLNHFRREVGFDTFLTSNKLTQLLRKIEVRSSQRRLEGKGRKRIYTFDKDVLQGWLERYAIR